MISVRPLGRQQFQRDVAQALVPAASALMPTPAFDTGHNRERVSRRV
jgi:hypothetical protein